MKVKIKCSYIIEVEFDDDYFEDVSPEFVIEENGCPGTGLVGEVLEKVMEECKEKHICWACKLQGENEILEVNGEKWAKNK